MQNYDLVYVVDITEMYDDRPVHKRYCITRNIDKIQHYLNNRRHCWYDMWGHDVEDADIGSQVIQFFDDMDHIEEALQTQQWQQDGHVVLCDCHYRGLQIEIRISLEHVS